MVRKDKKKPYGCAVCGMGFKTYGFWETHMGNHRKESKPKPRSRKKVRTQHDLLDEAAAQRKAEFDEEKLPADFVVPAEMEAIAREHQAGYTPHLHGTRPASATISTPRSLPTCSLAHLQGQGGTSSPPAGGHRRRCSCAHARRFVPSA